MNNIEKVAKEILAGHSEITQHWVGTSGGLVIEQELDLQYGTPLKDVQKIAKKLMAILKKEVDKVYKEVNFPDNKTSKNALYTRDVEADVFNNKVRALVDLTAGRDSVDEVHAYFKKNYKQTKRVH